MEVFLARLRSTGFMRLIALSMMTNFPCCAGGPGSLRVAMSGRVIRAAANSTSKACGVSGVFDPVHKHFMESASIVPECNKIMATNCSVSYADLDCPADCPYIVPNKAFTCLFHCSLPNRCSLSNPNTAYPDPSIQVCRKCDILGCQWCDERDVCKKCHPGFALSADQKRCTFSLFKTVEPPTVLILKVLGVLLAVLIIIAVVWHFFTRNRPDQNRDVNNFSIMRSRRHRSLVKVLKWQLQRTDQVTDRYNILAVDFQRENVLGIGIALFYRSVGFVFFISLLTFLMTMLCFKTSKVSDALSQLDPDPSLLLTRTVKPSEEYPAMVLSKLAVCSADSQANLQQEFVDFYGRTFWVVGFLFLTMFMMSLAHAYFQKKHAVWFNGRYATMSDYAVMMEGLPDDATDEGELREWLELNLRKAISSFHQRPPRMIYGGSGESDAQEEREDSQIEVHGISICYDFTDKVEEVQGMVQELVMRFEVEESRKVGKGIRAAHVGGAILLQQQKQEHREKVMKWFQAKANTDEQLKSTGRAYAVFRYQADKDRVLEYAGKNPGFLIYKGKQLSLEEVFMEPPSVYWHNMGKSQESIRANLKWGVAKVLVLIAGFQVLLFWPYAEFILMPFSRIGSESGGIVIIVVGILLGVLNGFLDGFIYEIVDGVGFQVKEDRETMNLYMTTASLFLNNFLNLGITLYTIARENGEDPIAIITSNSLSAIATLDSMARGIYYTTMPGMFFVGYLLAPIIGGALPFLQNTLLMKLIYTWRVFPQCMLRCLKPLLPLAPESMERYPYWCAEKSMEPEEISTRDYSDILVVVTTCVMQLFFVSPYVWQTFFGMLIWSVVFNCFLRYKHLRLSKLSFCTTDTVDIMVNYLWGVPLSVTALAWFFWAVHSGRLPGMLDMPLWQVGLIFVAVFTGSFGLWLLCYHFGIRPFDKANPEELEQKTVEEVKASTLYSWLNVNPIYVLKCEYFFHDECGRLLSLRAKGNPIASGEDPTSVRYFEVGKQYLFLKAERHHLVNADYDKFEVERWLELGMAGLGWVMGLCVKRTQDSVSQYLPPKETGYETVPETLTTVIVRRPFRSNNAKGDQIDLIEGLEGTVQRIDSKGDALIRFEGVDRLQWVFKRNMANLDGFEEGVDGMRSINSRKSNAVALLR